MRTIVEDLLRGGALVDLSIFNDPDVGLDVTHPELAQLLAVVQRQWQLQSHCIEYAISLFWGGSGEPMDDEAAAALTECCLSFPLKLRGHGLDSFAAGGRQDEKAMMCTLYKTRLHRQLLQYPISAEERIRRINSLWIDLVQTRFAYSAPRDDEFGRYDGSWDESEEVDRRLFPPVPSSLMKWDRVRRRREEGVVSQLKPEHIQDYLEPLVRKAEAAKLHEADLGLLVNCLTREQTRWLIEQPECLSPLDMMREALRAVRDVTYRDVVPSENPPFLRVDFVPPDYLAAAEMDGLVHAEDGQFLAVGFNESELEAAEAAFVKGLLERRMAESRKRRKHRKPRIVEEEEPQSASSFAEEPMGRPLRSDESDFSGSHRYRRVPTPQPVGEEHRRVPCDSTESSSRMAEEDSQFTIASFLVSDYVRPPLPKDRQTEIQARLEENEFTFQELVTYDWADIEPIFDGLPRAPILRIKKAIAEYLKNEHH